MAAAAAPAKPLKAHENRLQPEKQMALNDLAATAVASASSSDIWPAGYLFSVTASAYGVRRPRG
jgi:hypothetical protein